MMNIRLYAQLLMVMAFLAFALRGFASQQLDCNHGSVIQCSNELMQSIHMLKLSTMSNRQFVIKSMLAAGSRASVRIPSGFSGLVVEFKNDDGVCYQTKIDGDPYRIQNLLFEGNSHQLPILSYRSAGEEAAWHPVSMVVKDPSSKSPLTLPAEIPLYSVNLPINAVYLNGLAALPLERRLLRTGEACFVWRLRMMDLSGPFSLRIETSSHEQYEWHFGGPLSVERELHVMVDDSGFPLLQRHDETKYKERDGQHEVKLYIGYPINMLNAVLHYAQENPDKIDILQACNMLPLCRCFHMRKESLLLWPYCYRLLPKRSLQLIWQIMNEDGAQGMIHSFLREHFYSPNSSVQCVVERILKHWIATAEVPRHQKDLVCAIDGLDNSVQSLSKSAALKFLRLLARTDDEYFKHAALHGVTVCYQGLAPNRKIRSDSHEIIKLLKQTGWLSRDSSKRVRELADRCQDTVLVNYLDRVRSK